MKSTVLHVVKLHVYGWQRQPWDQCSTREAFIYSVIACYYECGDGLVIPPGKLTYNIIMKYNLVSFH